MGDGNLPAYEVDTIADIAPLDAQRGVTEKRNVPEALAEVVWGGDTQQGIFAVLDAAKVDGLPEMLEASELPHQYLYLNHDGLEAVAP